MASLKPHEKGAALAAYMERVGAKKQQGKRTDKAKGGTSATLAEVAAKLGVPRKTAHNHLQAAEDYAAAAPELRAKVDASVRLASAPCALGWRRAGLRDRAARARRQRAGGPFFVSGAARLGVPRRSARRRGIRDPCGNGVSQ